MIRVKVGTPIYRWLEEDIPGIRIHNITDTSIMLCNVANYDAFIVNKAHEQPNICLFAKLCKEKNKLVLICGEINNLTKDLLEIADTFEKVKS